MFDFLLGSISVVFGVMCLFSKESTWSLLVSVLPSLKEGDELTDEWRTNLNMLGGASLVTGAMLLLLL